MPRNSISHSWRGVSGSEGGLKGDGRGWGVVGGNISWNYSIIKWLYYTQRVCAGVGRLTDAYMRKSNEND